MTMRVGRGRSAMLPSRGSKEPWRTRRLGKRGRRRQEEEDEEGEE